eukprot:TRINITY_DN2163_c0_g1_i22.p1 TRINITY_DN2163_c0_g1~~TRINITY_DN2163_c0_g1_i22.p1  ORF type:complete len:612 (+),score=106.94 TRINITY_DN2163_c0_g1_i22:120-1955(+)
MEKKILLASLSQVKERKAKELITVLDTSTQQEVLDVLDKHQILAAPVRNKAGEFIAIVNKIDILTSFLFPHKEEKIEEKDAIWPKLNEPVSSVLKVSPETSTGASGFVSFVFEESDVLPQLLKAFSSGFHRVLVHSEKSNRLLSQSDVVMYFKRNIDALTSFKDTSVSEFFKKSVKTISSESTAFAAFRELLIQGVVAAPIISKDEKIVGTISLSDARGLNQKTASDLLIPVLDYLKNQGTQSLLLLEKKDTFATAVDKLISNHVHRAWVVENEKVIGVVSLSDICLFVFASPTLEKHYAKYLATLEKQVDLAKTPISRLLGERKEAVTVASTASQKEVLELMSKNKYLAVPVKDKDNIIGIATLLDIFTLLFLEKTVQAKGDKITKDELVAAWIENGKQNIDTTIFSRESVNFLIFDERESLFKVIESFAQGYHRVLVTSIFDSSTRFLSQTDVIAFLSSVIGKIGKQSKLQASKILATRESKLVTVASTRTALSAFQSLTTRELSAAPVVDSSGVLIASLSLSDLRGISSEDVPDLLLSVEEFLKKVHGGKIPKPITIKKDDTLADIIPLIAKARVHRVWVVDDDGKPSDVVSLTDINSAIFLDNISVD